MSGVSAEPQSERTGAAMWGLRYGIWDTEPALLVCRVVTSIAVLERRTVTLRSTPLAVHAPDSGRASDG